MSTANLFLGFYLKRRPEGRQICWALAGILLCGIAAVSQTTARSPAGELETETGKFRIYRMQLLEGEETYRITRSADSLLLRASFNLTDLGTHIPLTASLRMGPDYTPEEFEVHGMTSGDSRIDLSMTFQGQSAHLTQGVRLGDESLSGSFFPIGSYAPISIQMALFSYWTRHKAQGPIQRLPKGTITFERRGSDTIVVDGKVLQLRRFSIRGVVFGNEWVWADDAGQVIAVVTVCPWLDHIQALREGYESALPIITRAAMRDSLADLEALKGRIPAHQFSKLAISGATVVDGLGGPPLADATVIIDHNRIVAVGPRSQIEIPHGAHTIDARGQTMLPGLWDTHSHFDQVEWGPAYLAGGITTVRDCGNDFERITAERDLIASGRGIGPRILMAGFIDGDGPDSMSTYRAGSPQKAIALIKRYKATGFVQIKVYSSVQPSILNIIAAEAHRLGMTVTGHVPDGMNAFQGVEAGMDQINHVEFLPAVMQTKNSDQPSNSTPDDARVAASLPALAVDLGSPEALRAIQFFKDHGTVIEPTLGVYEFVFKAYGTPAAFEPGAAKVPPEMNAWIESMGVSATGVDRLAPVFAKYLAIVGALHHAGVPIMAGTDPTIPGHSLHRELELLVKAGFTPMEAIQAATLVPARVLKLDRVAGTIERGKRADLILTEANPLQNISNIRTVRTVISNGTVYRSDDLWKSVGFQP
jgi:hypothetical protein